ncbi:MAG: proprotein convertase P-domain-containing protein, partial [Bacteroidota bacterium]|nr:proprotein convertase P-domain-containing protein [Bacteroidota bacterium]
MLFWIGSFGSSFGQFSQFPFTSGPIPLCDTSTFTANVGGIGILVPMGDWGSSLYAVTINVTSDHPQTLQIFLTSPQGTTLSLSEFNGAGGQNYTNTTFTYDTWPPSITTGTAPFTGNWTAQGGALSIF